MDKTPLEKKELKDLLVKCWMTHDAMWFYHCLQECGIEKTNRINRAAVKAVAAVEIRRLRKRSAWTSLKHSRNSGNSFKRPWAPSRATS